MTSFRPISGTSIKYIPSFEKIRPEGPIVLFYDKREEVSLLAQGIYDVLRLKGMDRLDGKKRKIVLIDDNDRSEVAFTLSKDGDPIKDEIREYLSSRREMDRKITNEDTLRVKIWERDDFTFVNVFCSKDELEKYAEEVIRKVIKELGSKFFSRNGQKFGNFTLNPITNSVVGFTPLNEGRVANFTDIKTGELLLDHVDLPRILTKDDDKLTEEEFSLIVEQFKKNIQKEKDEINREIDVDITLDETLKPMTNRSALKKKEGDVKAEKEADIKLKFIDIHTESYSSPKSKQKQVDFAKVAMTVPSNIVEVEKPQLHPVSFVKIRVPKILSYLLKRRIQLNDVLYHHIFHAFNDLIKSNLDSYLDDDSKIKFILSLIIQEAKIDKKLELLLNELKLSGEATIVCRIEFDEKFLEKYDLGIDENLFGQALMLYRSSFPSSDGTTLEHSYPRNAKILQSLLGILKSKDIPIETDDRVYRSPMALLLDYFNIENNPALVAIIYESCLNQVVQKSQAFKNLLLQIDENDLFFYQYGYEGHTFSFSQMEVLSKALKIVCKQLKETEAREKEAKEQEARDNAALNKSRNFKYGIKNL